jgi:ATP-dependent Zn protease
MQMQVFCFFIGSLALIAVRKQRGVSASQFDQRKNAKRSNNLATANEVEIEFSTMIGQDEEMQPLRPIDIV